MARVVAHRERAWPEGLRRRLLAAMAPAVTSTQEICELNVLVAREFAAAVEGLLAAEKLPRGRIAAVASHGQTICHLPPLSSTRNQKAQIGSTLQLGDPSILATLTGITTVGNFRLADMAVGGQGAPLVPWADAELLSHARNSRCVQNIGGIGNVTYVPPRDNLKLELHANKLKLELRADTLKRGLRAGTLKGEMGEPVIAFDTGPGNMLIDAVVQLASEGRRKFDRDGRWADGGRLDERLLRELQVHAYFRRRPPKSTGREDFGMAFAKNLLRPFDKRKSEIGNLIHTLTRLTAWSIADSYRCFLPRMPDEVILCGGGADNPVLVRMLGEELGAGPAIRRIDEFGIPNKAKEAASFALLGAAALDGVPANVPSVTGARRAVVLGVIAR